MAFYNNMALLEVSLRFAELKKLKLSLLKNHGVKTYWGAEV
jgi:hypothetical protein